MPLRIEWYGSVNVPDPSSSPLPGSGGLTYTFTPSKMFRELMASSRAGSWILMRQPPAAEAVPPDYHVNRAVAMPKPPRHVQRPSDRHGYGRGGRWGRLMRAIDERIRGWPAAARDPSPSRRL